MRWADVSLNLDVVSLSSGSGYGLPNSIARVPESDQLLAPKKDAKENTRLSAAYEITLSKEAQELIARMEGSIRQVSDVRFEDLSSEEQNQVRNLEKQLTEIFGSPPSKTLRPAEKEQVAALYQRMDSVLGFEPKAINPMHHNLSRRLEDEADRLLADPKKVLTETEERQLAVIYSHLENLQGVSAVSYQIHPELIEHIDGLQREIDQISGVDKVTIPNSVDMTQATQVFQDLAGIYDGAFRRMMKLN